MLYSRARGVMLACGAASMLLAVPAESHACRCLDGLFGCGWGRTTYRAPFYAPAAYGPVAAPAYSGCATQSCSYVPQTCYRTVYRCVPATTCRAMTSCDPCTGCPVTTYRPVTTWAYRPQLVPYTTYRVVYSRAYNPCVSYGVRGTCNPCVGGACGVGATSAGASSCPSCAPAAAPVTTPSSPAPATSQQGSTFAPQPQAFQENSQPQPQKTLKPIPQPETKLNSTPTPNLIDPNNRTTLQPFQATARYRVVATPRRLPATISDTGWRASRD